MQRSELRQALRTVSPALGDGAELPVHACVCFDGDKVFAYDETVAILAPMKSDFVGAVPGKLLGSWTNAVGGAEVTISQKGKNLNVSCGKAKIALPVIGNDEFQFVAPNMEETRVFEMGVDEIHTIRQAMLAMGTDLNAKARLGLTVDFEMSDDDGTAIMVVYGTNNTTLTRAITPISVEADEDLAPFVLPPRFCELLVAHAHEGAVLYIDDGWIAADLDDGVEVYCRALTDMDVATFRSLFTDADEINDTIIPIPEEFADALTRSEILLSAAGDTMASIAVKGGTLHITTDTSVGRGNDAMKIEGDHDDVDERFCPELARRGLASAVGFRIYSDGHERKMCFFGGGLSYWCALGYE